MSGRGKRVKMADIWINGTTLSGVATQTTAGNTFRQIIICEYIWLLLQNTTDIDPGMKYKIFNYAN